MKSWQAFDLVIASRRRKRRADHIDVREVRLSSEFLIPLNTQTWFKFTHTLISNILTLGQLPITYPAAPTTFQQMHKQADNNQI